MFSKNLFFLCSLLIGIILFLYGASFYNAVLGWIGVYLILGGLLIFLIIYIYNGIFQIKQAQKQ